MIMRDDKNLTAIVSMFWREKRASLALGDGWRIWIPFCCVVTVVEFNWKTNSVAASSVYD